MNFSIKKFTAGIAMLAVVIFSLSYASFASYDVSILINGEKLEVSQPPLIMDGTTLVPLRDVFEGLGAKVSWDDEKRIATGEYNGTLISVHPDTALMLKNGEQMTLAHSPVIINDRILIPLRAVAESFGYSVLWRGSDYTVSISTDALMEVFFLDCGQADSIFIKLPDGKCMLVDAGEKSFGKELEAFIKEKGFNHIDYVLATHPHSDHIGGMEHIIKSFSIGTFYMPEVTHNTKTFEGMIDALIKNGCSCEYVSQGMSIAELPYKLEVLSPQNHTYAKMNNYSAAMKILYKNVSAILSADAEFDSEEEIIASGDDISADVLKLGHHGSSTSTSEAYLDAVAPKDAIISVGEGNSYGFPNEIVVNRLQKRGINIYRTDVMGNIHMTTDGYIYIIEGEK